MSDADNTLYSGRVNRQTGTISSSLLCGIQNRQDDAWSRMSVLYAPLVYYWCRRQGLQISDAEDVVQEVLLTVASRVGEFERNRVSGSFRGWLRTITRHKLGDFIRADGRRQQASDAAHERGDGSIPAQYPLQEESDGETLKEETKLVFSRVLELIRTRFAEPTWRAFLRVVMDGAAPRDVARELEMSVASVYQAKSRILQCIRDELREFGE